MTWTLWIVIINILNTYFVLSQEHIPPGVPPKHYQQPSSPHYNQNVQHISQQSHQLPQHQYHQQESQMHQVPQTQIPNRQQHIPVEQVSNMHGHHHGHPQQVLNAANIAQEKAHIAEHLDVPIDTNKMSEQELQFHYFKMHDADNNNKLDGCELIKSLIHWHEKESKEPSGANVPEKIFKDEELITLIDPILEMDDINKDGYIDYPEFIQAQQKAASTVGHQ